MSAGPPEPGSTAATPPGGVLAGAPETEILLRLTAHANDALTAEATYLPALTALRALMQVERASILLFDDDDVMRFKAWQGLSEHYRAAVEGHSPWRRGAVEPRAFCTPDVHADPELSRYRSVFENEQIRGLAFIPLVARGELLGKFMAYSAEPRAFDERTLQLGLAVATQVAQAVARARLIEAERAARALAERSDDRGRRLLSVTSKLSNALFATDVATLVIDEGTRTLGSRSAAIWLRDGDALTLLRHRGYSEPILERVRTLALDEDVPVCWVASSGEPVFIESQADYARACPELSTWSNGAQPSNGELAFACLPLSIHEQVIGVLSLAFPGQRRFDATERLFLRLLAQHCAQGLERARLYQDARKAAQRARLLAHASAILASSLDCEASLSSLCAFITDELRCATAIYLAPDGGDARCVALREPAHASAVSRGAALAAHAERAAARVLDGASGVLRVETGEPTTLTAPIRTHGRTFGALVLLVEDTTRSFGAVELELVVQLGERAAVAVHNASLHLQAVTAVRLRDEFLSVAAHELRTPVTALLLQAQSLARPLQPERVVERAGRITRYCLRLSKLVDELLDVTRITSGGLVLSCSETDLGEVVKEVVAGLGEQLALSGSEVVLAAEEPVRGTWDRNRLEQVAMNLLGNAIKYGESRPIELSLACAEAHAVLRVRDRGIGIAAEHHPRIFERFERAVSSRNFGGLGLGLWISRQIVEAHGGTISVESAVGQGAEFTVRLPLAPA